MTRREQWQRVVALAVWCDLVWTLLTWTLTTEVVVVGTVLSICCAWVIAPFGGVVRPWRVTPRQVLTVARLFGTAALRVVAANVKLARYAWARHPEPPSGMVITRTDTRTEGGIATVGVVTSLIVDNQLVDVQASSHRLLYHAVEVPTGTLAQRYDATNGPVDRRVAALEGLAE